MEVHTQQICNEAGIYDMKDTYGFLFDFWVYVVGKSSDISNTQRTDFKYGNLTGYACEYSGPGSFAFPICDGPGTFYEVLSSHNELGGTIFIKEQSQSTDHYFCVPWKNRDEILDVKRITIDSEYRDELIGLLRFLIDQSPVKKLYVQIRRQGLEKDNIVGMITVDQFGHMLNNDELLGNMVYVICEPYA